MKPVVAQDSEKTELQMTSMIDVVFLLLIFFIVTLRIPPDEGTLQAAVPKAKGIGKTKAPEEDPEKDFNDIRVMVRYSAQNEQMLVAVDNQQVYITKNELGDYNFDSLYARLKSKYQYNSNARVVIDCGDQVPYIGLIGALNATQGAGFRKISFANIR